MSGAGGIGDGAAQAMMAAAAAAAASIARGAGGAGEKDPHGGIEVLLVRHAESRNNVLHAEVGAKYGFDPAKFKEMEAEVAALRSEDADLSPKGYEQAEQLGVYLGERLKGRKVLVVSSPMVRAIKTIEPAAKRLGLGREHWLCYGRIHEVGGCYLQDKVFPGRSRQAIEAAHPLRCVDVPEGGWWAHGTGREAHHEALLRCEEASLWLHDLLLTGDPHAHAHASSGAAATGNGNGGGSNRQPQGPSFETLVVVGHGEFMHLLLKKLIGGGALSSSLGFVHGNTAITTVQFHKERGFLVRSLNALEHLPPPLRTGHTLADGWWEVVPRPHPSVNAPLIHRFRDIKDEDPALYRASQAVRRRYLGAALAEYAETVDPHAVHFLALAPGQATVVGVALYDPRHSRLRQLAVVPAYRGQGLGYGLVQAVKEEAKGRGQQHLTAHAPADSPALAFLRRKARFADAAAAADDGSSDAAATYQDRRGRTCCRLKAAL